jgi:hypothetical protein
MMATGGFLSPIVNQSLMKGINSGIGNITNNGGGMSFNPIFNVAFNGDVADKSKKEEFAKDVMNIAVTGINSMLKKSGLGNSNLAIMK